jgi:hypothetical protein
VVGSDASAIGVDRALLVHLLYETTTDLDGTNVGPVASLEDSVGHVITVPLRAPSAP